MNTLRKSKRIPSSEIIKEKLYTLKEKLDADEDGLFEVVNIPNKGRGILVK
jgi:hypothetical protein